MGSGTRPGAPALSGVILRPASSADLAEIAALERVSYGDPWPASAFASLPDNPRVFFSVARQDVRGALVGYVVAWYVLDEGELANLTITPALRKRGMGGVLLDAMLNDASSRGVTHIYLEVRESNTAARRLYDTRGFEEVGRRTAYYRNPKEDALVLRRTL